MLGMPDFYKQIDEIARQKTLYDIEHDLVPDYSKIDLQHAEKISKQKEITAQFIAEVNTLKNIKIELKNTYEKNHYNISNGYNMRYVNYTNTIKERLTLTEYNLDIVPFEEVEKNLEG